MLEISNINRPNVEITHLISDEYVVDACPTCVLISWGDSLTHGEKQMLPTYTSPCPKNLSVSHSFEGSCQLANTF